MHQQSQQNRKNRKNRQNRQNRQNHGRRAHGFTLIELMIGLVILAILSAMAWPSYSEHLKSAARNEAKAVMMEDVLLMEQVFTLNNSYGASAPLLAYPVSPKSGPVKYNISVDDGMSGTYYKLKAVPVTPDKCGTFTIDNTGKRELVGATASFEECWGRG
jgi:type IV pilus assembly protein PilE